VKNFKVTSIGVLLIVAILSAGGIFILDLFYLVPRLERLKWASLQEHGSRARNAIQVSLHSEKHSLKTACSVLADISEYAKCPEVEKITELPHCLQEVLLAGEVDIAWYGDENGRVKKILYRSSQTLRDNPAEPLSAFVAKSLEDIGYMEVIPETGLFRFDNRVGVFAQKTIGRDDTGKLGESFWVVRIFDSTFCKDLASSINGSLIFVPGDKLPKGTASKKTSGLSLWLPNENDLAVAWRLKDVAGRDLGYLQAAINAVSIQRQSAIAHRTVIIVLSLSVGLCILVILGVHMLLVGPVVRLLRRLQKLEKGGGSTEELTKNLHGEPLVLARRLATAFDKLSELSMTDQLTGLANRRHFEEVLHAFYHQARRYNRPLSLIIIDVDFFKAINDTAGHQKGDEFLRHAAGAIEQACRKADLPARLGGDEFAVLLPETPEDDAVAVAERIHHAFEEEALTVNSLEIKSSVSIGVTDLNAGPIDTPATMFALADRALYAAKELGRNRIFKAQDLDGLEMPRCGSESKKVDVLCRKLAGLDGAFKNLFVQAVQEIVEILRHRDPFMANHTRKVAFYSELIAEEMGLPERVLQRLQLAAMFHDIGMVALPDSILLSPEPLTDEQVKLVRKHPLIAVRIMERMEFLEQEIPAVRYHHERFDGKGYPEGISGSAIPLTARILAVADAFDAMTSPRIFRSSKPVQDAVVEIEKNAGTQFDPVVVEALVAISQKRGDKLLDVPDIDPEDILLEFAQAQTH